MTLADFPQLKMLSTREKLGIVDELWLSMGKDVDEQGVSDAEKSLLDDRWAKYESDPSSAMTLEMFKQRMAAHRA
jgi:putative addiction module component (TIGR02574 family)